MAIEPAGGGVLRKFIRHPVSIPIEIVVDESESDVEARVATARNISSGGLAFGLLHPVVPGARITISLSRTWPDCSASGTVVWCQEAGAGFEAGVQFSEVNEAFKARMVEQFCQIEDYRRDVREREGRDLDSEEAAKEWIVRYAAEFAKTLDS
jgi:hypothetical protein